jgi:hypothetical protein
VSVLVEGLEVLLIDIPRDGSDLDKRLRPIQAMGRIRIDKGPGGGGGRGHGRPLGCVCFAAWMFGGCCGALCEGRQRRRKRGIRSGMQPTGHRRVRRTPHEAPQAGGGCSMPRSPPSTACPSRLWGWASGSYGRSPRESLPQKKWICPALWCASRIPSRRHQPLAEISRGAAAALPAKLRAAHTRTPAAR